MPDNDQKLLEEFDKNMHKLFNMCIKRKRQIEDLEASLKEKDDTIQQAERMITTLKANYTNLLTARRLADDKEAFQQARKQVNKLVREVDLCIALLNE